MARARHLVLTDEEILAHVRAVFVQRGYAAGERTLTADPAFIDSVVRVLLAN